MNFVRQTRFGGPDAPPGEQGNCYAACLASLFHFPLHSIPVYPDKDWFLSYQRWLRPRGLMVMVFHENPFSLPEYSEFGVCVASGMGPRGYRHAVLWQDGKLLHDPHPSNAGLVSVDEYDVFVITNPDRYWNHCRPRYDDRWA